MCGARQSRTRWHQIGRTAVQGRAANGVVVCDAGIETGAYTGGCSSSIGIHELDSPSPK
jgi:hypothetical protein